MSPLKGRLRARSWATILTYSWACDAEIRYLTNPEWFLGGLFGCQQRASRVLVVEAKMEWKSMSKKEGKRIFWAEKRDPQHVLYSLTYLPSSVCMYVCMYLNNCFYTYIYRQCYYIHSRLNTSSVRIRRPLNDSNTPAMLVSMLIMFINSLCHGSSSSPSPSSLLPSSPVLSLVYSHCSHCSIQDPRRSIHF